MTDLKPNAELAYAVLDQIDAHPEQWNQAVYIGQTECGTVACFAGWTVLLSGFDASFPYGKGGKQQTVEHGEIVDHSGRIVYIAEVAENLLRASRWVDDLEDADDPDNDVDLFSADNSRGRLGELVERVFGPRSAPDGA